jgi:protein arginine kinase
MKSEIFEKFMLTPVKWLNKDNTDENIVLSSRISLSRNISNISFPINSSEIERKQALNTLISAVETNKAGTEFKKINMAEISEVDRLFLLERKLITTQLGNSVNNSCLLVDEDETLQVMVNEEDHLKLQMLKSGMSLREIWKELSVFDSEISQKVPFAFDNSLGYLTSSPLKVGTGMKASVMLNLPALTLAKQIAAVIKGINKLGLTVNSVQGENSSYIGNLYLISNQSTLGELEEKIIEKIENIVNQIVIHEKNARVDFLENKKEYIFNYIGRAYGILRHSHILTLKESLDYLSILRMGVDLKMFSSVDFKIINDLLISVQNAHLQKYTALKLSYSELDIMRADMVRNKLQM